MVETESEILPAESQTQEDIFNLMSKYNPQYVRLTSDSTLALGACDGANDSWDTLQPL